MEKPYQPSISETTILKMLSSYKKINYNRFRWWRWFDKNKPLPNKYPLIDKIRNGEFDNFVYFLQSILCEHMLNQIWEDSKGDILKYNENSIKLQLRRQKLLEDYWKNDEKILSSIPKIMAKEFKIEKELVKNFMEEFDGTTLELYYYLEKNQIKFKSSLIKFINEL